MNDTAILAQLDHLDAALNTGVEFARTAHQGSVGIHNPRHEWFSAGGVSNSHFARASPMVGWNKPVLSGAEGSAPAQRRAGVSGRIGRWCRKHPFSLKLEGAYSGIYASKHPCGKTQVRQRSATMRIAVQRKSSGTSGRKRVTPTGFLSLEIPVPSLEEQSRLIADFARADEMEREAALLRQSAWATFEAALFTTHEESVA